MCSEENFLLKWNNHQTNLVGVFKDWLQDESFVDVTLVCGGEAVSGHKVVLAASSPLLNQILHDNPCRHPVVILNDVRSADIKALLNFIYQGEVSVSQSELASFLRTAENLQIKGLAEDKKDKDKKRKDKDHDKNTSSKKRKKNDTKLKCLNSNSHSPVPQQEISNNFNNLKHSNFKSINDFASSFKNAHTNHLNNDVSLVPLEADFETSDNKDDILIVKSEPMDYAGEMAWQEGTASSQKENLLKSNSHFTKSNVTENIISETHNKSTNFSLFTSSLNCLSSASNLDVPPLNFQTNELEDKQADSNGDATEVTQDDILTQANFLSSFEECTEEDSTTSSTAKFRSGRKPCCFCGKTFCDNYTLRRHMVTHLARQRQFECSLCAAAYSRKDHLMAHMRRKHPVNENCDSETFTKLS